jgi:beta-phosphoglucomutase family hydrolase
MMSAKRPLWGAIFDFDGVVIDSEKSHEECWQKVAERRSKPIARDAFLYGFGLKNERFIKEVLGWTQDDQEVAAIIKEKERYFQDLVAARSIPLIPGIVSFLDALAERGVPCVIGSSSILKNIDIALEATKLTRYFQKIVSGEDVKAGKPNPEVFLLCAEKIGFPPERCIVFEDALFGIEAAKRARMRAVAITTTFPKERFIEWEFKPDSIVAGFNEISLDVLNSWF